jgi:uncharacterized protein YbjT (DUF2867 family)
MILVAGGSGRLGSLLVPRLAGRGLGVRVLTRKLDRARHLDGVADIAVGDVRDRGSIELAMTDVATIVSAVQGFAGPGRVTPASVDRDGNINLIDSAAAAGAEMVMLSVVGASPGSPMDLFRAKHDAERYLRASAVGWTIVRSTAFVELWVDIMRKHVVFGRGDNPINFVSVHDVVAAVEAAVIDPSLRGQTLEIGGPQDITLNELSAAVEENLGGDKKARHIPPWLLHAIAPFVRQARAGYTMDTMDMTFDGTCALARRSGLRPAIEAAIGRPVADKSADQERSRQEPYR